MLRLSALSLALGLLTGAHAAVPDPLAAALKRGADDFDRWAYTETTIARDKDGKPEGGETIVRFDPSKPFEEQFTPLKVDGHEPTEKERGKYRKEGVARGKQLQQDADKPKPDAGKDDDAPPVMDLNGQKATVDLEHAKLVEEQGVLLTYEIPLQPKGKGGSIPLDKLKILLRVNRERGILENVRIRLLAPFRLKLVAKISSGEFNLDFAEVETKYPPVLAALRVDFSASVLFFRKTGSFEDRRTDFQRVKPYFEKFGVKIGPLKALPF
jgi:hypothetical protein